MEAPNLPSNGRIKYLSQNCDHSTVDYTDYSSHVQPEKNLLLAIVERAIEDYVGMHNPNDRGWAKHKHSAWEFLFEGEEYLYDTSPFAFFCDVLDLDPVDVRCRTTRLKLQIEHGQREGRRPVRRVVMKPTYRQ